MTTDLSYLIELQKHDSAIQELEEKAQALDPQIASKKETISKLKADLKSEKDALTQYQVKKKELENKVAEKEGLIKKHQGELNNLKSNDAYKAMLGEIDVAKKDLTAAEDEILNLMEETEKGQSAYKEKEKSNQDQEQKINSEIKSIEEEKSKYLSEAKGKKEARNTYAATVPENIRSQYESVKTSRGGVAIVAVEDNACGECRMSITQSKMNDLKKAKDMIVCESCSRILYIPEKKSSDSSIPASSSS